MQKVSYDLPSELIKELKIKCVNENCTQKKLVQKYIEYGLKHDIK